MSCMLAALCLYVDLAVGHVVDDDLNRYTAQAEPPPQEDVTGFEGPGPQPAPDWHRSATQARVTFGMRHKPTGLYLEGTHRSDPTTREDKGVQSVWGGLRYEF